MSADKSEPKASSDALPNGPDYGFRGYWYPPPYSAFGMPFFGLPYCGMPYPGAPPSGIAQPGTPPYAAGNPAIPSYSAGFEAVRQLFMSRAEFWSHMMQAIADIALHAAGVAAEARKASEMMGPGGSNVFAPPGGPYTRPPDTDVDLDKLKQSLQGLDQAQAAKILYAVQLVQSMDAARRTSPPGGQAGQTGW
jgi:hypothetical protein